MKSIHTWSLLTIVAAAAGALLLGCEPTGVSDAGDSSTPRKDAATGPDSTTHTDAATHPDTAGHDVPRTDSAGRDTHTGTDSHVATDSAGSDGSVTAVDKTIQEIQGGSVAAYTCVRVQGVMMSALFNDRDDSFSPPDAGSTPHPAFYLSAKGITTTAPNTGIEVVFTNVTPPSGLVPGDDLTVVATYSEHYEMSTLRVTAECGQVTKNASGLTLPTAATVVIADLGQTGGSADCPATTAWTESAAAETWEGVLVKITAGAVDEGLDQYGMFQVTDSTYKLEVSDMLISNSAYSANLNDTVQSITGFQHFSWCRRKLRPQADADVVLTAGAVDCGAAAAANHLVISEVKIGPTKGEFVEIHNPTSAAIDLSDYYLYNATYAGATTDGGTTAACRYYNIVTGTQCGTDNSDFSLRFPAGATIAAGAYQVIALTGAANFCEVYFPSATCTKPDYEIPAAAPGDAEVTDISGSWDHAADIFTTYGYLTSSREDLVLFSWDGNPSSLVKDLDYFIWGTDVGIRTDKTGVSTYLADTAVAAQSAPAGSINNSQSFQRMCYNEGSETKTGGNGIGGHNETSENLAATFVVRDPSIGVRTVGAP